MPFTQDRFLSNTENKVGLIKFLSLHLQEEGIYIINYPGDADSTIVKTALEIAQKILGPITVVADDTYSCYAGSSLAREHVKSLLFTRTME